MHKNSDRPSARTGLKIIGTRKVHKSTMDRDPVSKNYLVRVIPNRHE